MEWISFASAMNNETYIEKLLKRYKITDYHFSANGYGDYDLYLVYGLDTFKISIDETTSKLIIYRKTVYRKAQKKRKEYFIKVNSIGGVDCWLECIWYIIRK